MRRSVVVAAALLAACGGGGGGQAVGASASAIQAVQEFMGAARDSNMTRMAALWGASGGPAGQTRSPKDWERRLVVLQAYLRGDSARVTSDVGVSGDANRRRLVVSLFRATCATPIPVVAIRTRSGSWIVNSVDLSSAGNPARPCEPGSRPNRGPWEPGSGRRR
ncbi:MAG TPA: hypothetical protein VGQ17_12540 [Gemmatimonadales bacterium]|jgi:hypothetical protein|nr:hypothetical protein [Gemmatimonadales bacterium]